jgi:dihydropteroate synthase
MTGRIGEQPIRPFFALELLRPRAHYAVPLPGREPLVLGGRTLVMGILNVTPDSFADGGRHFDVDRAVGAGLAMVEAGADIIDVGGESTRPGSDPLPEYEELRRVLPAIERLATRVTIPISVDTSKAGVARAACAAGATIVNDISGLLYDPDLAAVAADAGAALVLMHMRGRSKSMYALATYGNVADDITRELGDAIDRATSAGVPRDAIVVDPGLGFAKQPAHSYAALMSIGRIGEQLDRPILSGPSRKSFLTAAIGQRAPDEREWATAAAVAASVLVGAHIVRVHGVAAMVDVVRVADRLRDAQA